MIIRDFRAQSMRDYWPNRALETPLDNHPVCNIVAGAVDVVVPDMKYCGGTLELKKIAQSAAFGMARAQHFVVDTKLA